MMQNISTGAIYVQVHVLNDDIFQKVPGLLRGVVYGPLNDNHTAPSLCSDKSLERLTPPPKVLKIFKWKLWDYLKVTFGFRNLLKDLVGNLRDPIDPKDGSVKFLDEVKRFTVHRGWCLDESTGAAHIDRMRKFCKWIQTRSDLWDKLRQRMFHDILNEFDLEVDNIELDDELLDELDQYAIIIVDYENGGKLPKKLSHGTYNVASLSTIPTEDFPVLVVAMVPSLDAPIRQKKIFEKLISAGFLHCVVGSLPDSDLPQYDTIDDANVFLKSIVPSEFVKIKATKEEARASMKNISIVIAAAMPPGSGKSTIFHQASEAISQSVAMSVVIQSDMYPSPTDFNQKLKKLLKTGVVWCKENPGKQYFVFYDKNVPNLEGLCALQRNVLKDFPVTVRWFTQTLLNLDELVKRIMTRNVDPAFPKALVPREDLGEAEIRDIVCKIFYSPSVNFQREFDIPKVNSATELVAKLTPDEDECISLSEAQFIQGYATSQNYFALVPTQDTLDEIRSVLKDSVPMMQDKLHVTILHKTSPFWRSHRSVINSLVKKEFYVTATELVCDDRAIALKVNVSSMEGQAFTRPDSGILHITLWCAEGTKPIYAGTDLMINPSREEKPLDIDLSKWRLEACI
tara:strand:- start:1061 stop:2941 length:1881 start_codon:yes stop_codon:yes gene_type:complete